MHKASFKGRGAINILLFIKPILIGAKSGGWSEHRDIPASLCVEYGYDVLLCASVSYDH